MFKEALEYCKDSAASFVLFTYFNKVLEKFAHLDGDKLQALKEEAKEKLADHISKCPVDDLSKENLEKFADELCKKLKEKYS